MPRHLHILTQKRERLQRIHLIEALAGIWREQGNVVSYGDPAARGRRRGHRSHRQLDR
jgi:hypothetical protein